MELNRDKQIEEMAKDIEDVCENRGCNYENGIRDCDKCRAEWLYELGYRKASDVAREIFEEIIEALADEQITEAQKASAALEAQDTLSYEVFNYAEDKLGTIVLALSLCKKKYSEGCDV